MVTQAAHGALPSKQSSSDKGATIHGKQPPTTGSGGSGSGSGTTGTVLQVPSIMPPRVTPKMTRMTIPPDEPLKRMDIILNKRLCGITLQQFYSLWNEEPDKPMYRTWLECTGKKDISIQEWNQKLPVGSSGSSSSGSSSSHVDSHKKKATTTATTTTAPTTSCCWDDGQSYPMQRIVTFTVARTSHLYMGPPTASVRHLQQRRLDHDQNRCVLLMQIDMLGIPFSDCFQVYIRWVATTTATTTTTTTKCQQQQQDNPELDIQVGVHVHFLKSTMYVPRVNVWLCALPITR